MKWDFDHALAIGEIGQEIVCRDVIEDRWSYMPLHDIAPRDGHGPRLTTDGAGITLPDARITKHGLSLAAEIKTKTSLTMGILSGEPEHGIDQDCYDHMRDYERRQGETVILIVVELFRIDRVPNSDEDVRMVPTTPAARLIDRLLKAENEELADHYLGLLREAVHSVNGILCAPLANLRPRPGRDNTGNAMCYFPRSQLRSDWLDSLNRRVLYRDRPRARRAGESEVS